MGEVLYTAVCPDGRQAFVAFSGGGWLIGAMPGPLTPETAAFTKPPVVDRGQFSPTSWSRDGRWLGGTS